MDSIDYDDPGDLIKKLENFLTVLSDYMYGELLGIVDLQPLWSIDNSGQALRAHRSLEMMCGEKCLSSIILATTGWEGTDIDQAIRSERELLDDHLRSFIAKGIEVYRHDSGLVSATTIIKRIIAKRQRVTLAVQEELAAGKRLAQTGVGRAILGEGILPSPANPARRRLDNLTSSWFGTGRTAPDRPYQ